MLQNIPSVYVGLDVHKESLTVALASPERGGEIRFYGNIPDHQQSINHVFLKLQNQYSSVMVCYEAGPSHHYSCLSPPIAAVLIQTAPVA